MTSIRDWAKAYRDIGLAVCRIAPGDKRPNYKGWNLKSLEPGDFREGDSIGIQSGRLSGDLVTIDLDTFEAVKLAPEYLPPTSSTEGRPGKPLSHWRYRVKNIPASLAARPHVAGGMGGPINLHFDGRDGRRVLDFLGSGLQAVAPPSIWTSKNGTSQEQRAWHQFGEPTVVDAVELYNSVCRLATACGWAKKETRERQCPERAATPEVPPLQPLPTTEAARQARAYLAKVPPAVQGEGGDARTFFAAALLVLDFGLTVEEALPVLLEWNRNCSPPWTTEELVRKLNAATTLEGERGWRVRRRSGSVVVSIRPDDKVIFVGVDCEGDRSFISFPTLRAAVPKVGDHRELSPQLAEIAWDGLNVFLAPPSTVTTNMREVWDEFYLGRLLGQLGADVKTIRIPPLNGRRRTLAMTPQDLWRVIDPPENVVQASARAKEAGKLATEVDAYRRSLPRRKSSPRVDTAKAFIIKHCVTSLTTDILKKARRKGITRDALRRGLGLKKN
jgi:hypothetical protein